MGWEPCTYPDLTHGVGHLIPRATGPPGPPLSWSSSPARAVQWSQEGVASALGHYANKSGASLCEGSSPVLLYAQGMPTYV
jgi:hypothetical protein